jgi:hypothetical protein
MGCKIFYNDFVSTNTTMKLLLYHFRVCSQFLIFFLLILSHTYCCITFEGFQYRVNYFTVPTVDLHAEHRS